MTSPQLPLDELQRLEARQTLTPAEALAHYETVRQRLPAPVADRMGVVDVDTLRYYRRQAVGVLSPPVSRDGTLTRRHVEELLVVRLGAAVRRWSLPTAKTSISTTPDLGPVLQALITDATQVRPLAKRSIPALQPSPHVRVPARPLALPPVPPTRLQLPGGVTVEIPVDAPVWRPGPERRALLRALAQQLQRRESSEG